MPTARFLILAATIQSVIIASEGYWSQGWQVCVTVLVWRWTALDHLSGTLPTPCLHFIFGWPLSPLLVPATHWRDWMLMPKMQPLSCMLLLFHSFKESPQWPPLLTSQLAVPQSCSHGNIPVCAESAILTWDGWITFSYCCPRLPALTSGHKDFSINYHQQIPITWMWMHSVENVSINKIHRPCAGQCKRTTANVALHTACCAHVV